VWGVDLWVRGIEFLGWSVEVDGRGGWGSCVIGGGIKLTEVGIISRGILFFEGRDSCILGAVPVCEISFVLPFPVRIVACNPWDLEERMAEFIFLLWGLVYISFLNWYWDPWDYLLFQIHPEIMTYDPWQSPDKQPWARK